MRVDFQCQTILWRKQQSDGTRVLAFMHSGFILPWGAICIYSINMCYAKGEYACRLTAEMGFFRRNSYNIFISRYTEIE